MACDRDLGNKWVLKNEWMYTIYFHCCNTSYLVHEHAPASQVHIRVERKNDESKNIHCQDNDCF